MKRSRIRQKKELNHKDNPDLKDYIDGGTESIRKGETRKEGDRKGKHFVPFHFRRKIGY